MVNRAKSLQINHIGFQATPEHARTDAEQRGTLKTRVARKSPASRSQRGKWSEEKHTKPSWEPTLAKSREAARRGLPGRCPDPVNDRLKLRRGKACQAGKPD
jgi:hypothetical protein